MAGAPVSAVHFFVSMFEPSGPLNSSDQLSTQPGGGTMSPDDELELGAALLDEELLLAPVCADDAPLPEDEELLAPPRPKDALLTPARPVELPPEPPAPKLLGPESQAANATKIRTGAPPRALRRRPMAMAHAPGFQLAKQGGPFLPLRLGAALSASAHTVCHRFNGTFDAHSFRANDGDWGLVTTRQGGLTQSPHQDR